MAGVNRFVFRGQYFALLFQGGVMIRNGRNGYLI